MIQFCVSLVCEFHGALPAAGAGAGDEAATLPLVAGVSPTGVGVGPENRAPAWLTGEVQARPREQPRVESEGHDELPAVDLLPDAVLSAGLERWLREALVEADLEGLDPEAVRLQTLRVRITNYRYLHALLVLDVPREHVARLEELTPLTIRPIVLDHLELLQPAFARLAEAAVIELDSDRLFGVPHPLRDWLEPREDTYLYERHLLFSGPDRDVDAFHEGPTAPGLIASEAEDRPLAVPGGTVHHPWAAPIWRLEVTPDRAELNYLLEADTLVLAQRSAYENSCTVSHALGEAVRRHFGRPRAKASPLRRRATLDALPMTTAELRLLALHYALITNELGQRPAYLHDWQRKYQRAVLAEESLEAVMGRAARGNDVVAAIVAHQEESDLHAHQTRVELVISVLTLLTVYSVAATVISFIRSERIGLVGDRLVSGETLFLALLSVGVVLVASRLWRRR